MSSSSVSCPTRRHSIYPFLNFYPCVSSVPIMRPGEVGRKRKRKKKRRKEKDLNCLGNSTRFEWHAAFIPLGPRAFAHDASSQAHCGHSSPRKLQTGRSWAIFQLDSCLLGFEGRLYCGLGASYCWVWDMLAQRPYSCTVALLRLTQQQVGPLWALALDLLLYFWQRCSPLACVKMHGHNGALSAFTEYSTRQAVEVSDCKMNWLLIRFWLVEMFFLIIPPCEVNSLAVGMHERDFQCNTWSYMELFWNHLWASISHTIQVFRLL